MRGINTPGAEKGHYTLRVVAIVKIHPYCVGVDILIAKTLVWYTFLGFFFTSSLAYSYSSSIQSLLERSIGEKTRARLHQERKVCLHYAQWLSPPPTVRFTVHFNMPARIVGGGKNTTAHSGDGPFAPGEVAHWFSLQ